MKIYLSPPDVGADEEAFVMDAVRSGWVAPLGPHLNAFESELQAKLGGGHVVGLASGTAALHLSLIMAGVSRDDTVLVSSFTFAASANPIVYLGATPVFIGSEAETWNMCPDALLEAIKSCCERGKKPKAIVVVHLYGMPAKIKRIKEIADEYEIALIEDAAESLGASAPVGMTGVIGEFGILSFNGNKLITTSGGGALICSSEESASRARYLSTQARQPAAHYEHTEIGYNYRLSNICAAIGRAQLKTIDEKIARRREHFEYYASKLRPIGAAMPDEGVGVFANRWLSIAKFPQSLARNGQPFREIARLALMEQGIESRPAWKPMHMQPVFQDTEYFGQKIEEELFELCLCLPSGSNLQAEQREEVCEIITSLV